MESLRTADCVKTRKWNLKKQSQFYRSAFRVLRTATRNLKKQSQFVKGRIGTKSYIKGDYKELYVLKAVKNKPKQSQFIRSAF